MTHTFTTSWLRPGYNGKNTSNSKRLQDEFINPSRTDTLDSIAKVRNHVTILTFIIRVSRTFVPLCKVHFPHSRQLQLKPRKTRQRVLRASAFKSKLLHSLLLIKDFDSVLLLWNRDGEFMVQMPTPAHLVPTQQGGHCSFLQRIFLTSVNQAPATKRFK